MFKVNNNTPEWRQWRRSCDVAVVVVVVKFEHISHSVSIVDFEQVNVSWENADH